MGLQRKMYEANKALAYFVTNDWTFENDNTIQLCRFLRTEDTKDFDYRGNFTFDVILTARNVILGYRRYLLKEDDASLPQSRKTYRRLQLAVNIARYIFYSFAFYLIFLKYDVIHVAQRYFAP